MDELQEQLNGILNDPAAMQKILSMAQALGGDSSQNKQERPTVADFDLGMVQKLSGLASQSSIDKREQALLRALCSSQSSVCFFQAGCGASFCALL